MYFSLTISSKWPLTHTLCLWKELWGGRLQNMKQPGILIPSFTRRNCVKRHRKLHKRKIETNYNCELKQTPILCELWLIVYFYTIFTKKNYGAFCGMNENIAWDTYSNYRCVMKNADFCGQKWNVGCGICLTCTVVKAPCVNIATVSMSDVSDDGHDYGNDNIWEILLLVKINSYIIVITDCA